MKFLKEHGSFVIIFGLCAILRFIPLFQYQFTFDELSGLDRTQFNSFSEVIEKGVKIDAHPALVQLIIFYLSKFFGYSTWILKLPFLLFSLGAVFFAYKFTRRNFSKQAALFASVIFSFSLIFVFYAPIARMYISGVFFSIALLYYFYEVIFHKSQSLKNYFFLGFFALLAALNHHMNALFAFTVVTSGFLFLDKKIVKGYLFTLFLTIIFYLPHLPVTLYQLSVPGIGRDVGGWLEVPDFFIIINLIKILFGTGKIYLLFFGLFVLAIMLNRNFRFSKQNLLLLTLFLINYLIVYFYSLFRSPIYQHSVMLFSATAFILWLCSFLEFKSLTLFYLSLILVFGLLINRTYFKKDYFNESVKTVYEYQFERTIEYKKLYGENNVYPLFFDCDTLMRKIYFSKYKTKFEFKLSSDSIISFAEKRLFEKSVGDSAVLSKSSIRMFSEFVSNLSCDFITISSSTPLYQEIVRQYFPYLIENTNTQAINFKVYSKKQEDKERIVQGDKVLSYASRQKPSPFLFSKDNSEQDMVVDSLSEFPFSAKTNYDEVIDREGVMVLVKSRVKFNSLPSTKLETVISTGDKTNSESYGYNSKDAGDFLRQKDSTILMLTESYVGNNFARIQHKAMLNSYFWNRGKDNFEINSFEIQIVDFWPNKWHFWD